MQTESTAISEYLLLGLALLAVLLPVLNGRIHLPFLQVLSRWVRWFLFAAIFAFSLDLFELSGRPYWVHYVTGIAIWFLLETAYNWIAIKALSRSDLPLFPDFQTNNDGDEWPADKQSIDLKDWLSQNDYKRLGSLKAEVYEETFLRATVYEQAQSMTRIQILFIPKRKGEATACYTITTNGKDGGRLITDNQFLPYGGYYPKAWNLCRKPLIGSLQRLLTLHHRRLLGSDINPCEFEDDPLAELNEQQRILERLNIETGFLVPRQYQEEEGKITYEGRYRLWKEMWMLAYLGKSVS